MSAAGSIIGGSFNFASNIQQGFAAKQAADFNAKIADYNAGLAKKQAAEDERKFRYQVQKQAGQNRASIGASGLQLDGSALEAMEDSARQAQQDALTIRYQGDVKAWGFGQEASMQRKQGRAAMDAGYFGAVGSLFGAGAKAATS